MNIFKALYKKYMAWSLKKAQEKAKWDMLVYGNSWMQRHWYGHRRIYPNSIYINNITKHYEKHMKAFKEDYKEMFK
jgi:hypothetical protein